MRRYHVPIGIFDTRAAKLRERPTEAWSEEAKQIHAENIERLRAEIAHEYGPANLDMKLQNFADVGSLPFSIISHHNDFLSQARDAFVMGQYYPSLTAACSLGERMLNHMIMDVKRHFPPVTSWSAIQKETKLQNWPKMIDLLREWDVLVPEAAGPFRELNDLRNDSVHFNPSTYTSLRSDAQKALGLLGHIIDEQYACLNARSRWLAWDNFRCFVKKEFEDHPFISEYYQKQCPKVGPYYSYRRYERLWLMFDWKTYDEVEISDMEYADLKKQAHGGNRSAPSEIGGDDVICFTWIGGQYYILKGVVATPDGAALEMEDPFFGVGSDPRKKGPIIHYYPEIQGAAQSSPGISPA